MQKIQFRAPVRCPFCHDDLRRGGARQGCPQCLTWHHAECLADHGRCASCGAASAHPSQALVNRAVEDALARRQDGCVLQGCLRERAVGGHCSQHAPTFIRHTRRASRILLGFGISLVLVVGATLTSSLLQAGTARVEGLFASATIGLLAAAMLGLGETVRRSASQLEQQLEQALELLD